MDDGDGDLLGINRGLLTLLDVVQGDGARFRDAAQGAILGIGRNKLVFALFLLRRSVVTALLHLSGQRLGRVWSPGHSIRVVVVNDGDGDLLRRDLGVLDHEVFDRIPGGRIGRIVRIGRLGHSDLTVGNGHGPGLVGLHIALGGLGLAEGIGIAGGNVGDGDSTLIIRSAFQGPGVSEGTTFGNGQLEFRASQRSKLVVNTLDLGEVQLAQVALGSNIGESNALGLAIIHLEGKGRSTQGIGRFLFKVLGLGAHPDLIAQMIGLLIVRSTSLGSGFAEVPGDLIVIRGSAVGVAIELHEVIQISQSAFANFVIDRSHNGGTDRLMLNGVDDGLERGIQSIGAVGFEHAFHLAVIFHPGINRNGIALAVGDGLHGAVFLGEAIDHAKDMDASGLQLGADGLHRAVHFAGSCFAIANIASSRNWANRTSTIAPLANGIGGLAISEEHHELILSLPASQQVGRQLETRLGIGATASDEAINRALRRFAVRLFGDIHHRHSRIGILRILHHRNIAGLGGGAAAGVLGIVVQEILGGLLGGSQAALEGMCANRDPLLRVGRDPAPEPIPFICFLAAIIADVIAVCIRPIASRLGVALVDPLIAGRAMILAFLSTLFAANGAVAHGAGGINDQDCGGLRVGGDGIVLGGDFQIHVEKVLRASLSKGTRKLDRPIVLRTLRTVCLVVDGVARVRDLLRLVSLRGECRDLHQAQAHYQGHEQAQCPLADGLAPGGSLARIVICHDSFPP